MLRAHPRLVRAHAAALTDKLAARLTDEEHEPREALRSLLKTALLPNLSVRVATVIYSSVVGSLPLGSSTHWIRAHVLPLGVKCELVLGQTLMDHIGTHTPRSLSFIHI